MSLFRTTLLDDTNQPNLVVDSAGRLSWTLFNNARSAEQTLEVTPFSSGGVSDTQFHFRFDFTPGALTDAPTLKDMNVDPSKRLTWNVAVKKDGSVSSLYIALAGKTPLQIPAGGNYQATLTDVHAVQTDAHQPTTAVKLAAGDNVKLAGKSIKDEKYGPFDLTLVRPSTFAGAPLAVDFVGRRTVLNDGKTANIVTFSLTNMMLAKLRLTPEKDPSASPTKFTVWFDAAPKKGDFSDPSEAANYPWALARADQLAFVVTPPPEPKQGVAGLKWSASKLIKATALLATALVAGNPQWEIAVEGVNGEKDISLAPQTPVLFTVSNIITDFAPGVTRMYLWFQNVPGYRDGILVAELEKTPLSYGASPLEAGALHREGLYLSAGVRSSLPPPDYESGLYVQQFGTAPAAIFNGGNVGIGTLAPKALLEVNPPADWAKGAKNAVLEVYTPISWDNNKAALRVYSPDTAYRMDVWAAYEGDQVSYEFRPFDPHGNAEKVALTIRTSGNVGIATPKPGSALSVAGGAAIGKTYAEKSTAANDLAVEGSVGIGTLAPKAKLEVHAPSDWVKDPTNPNAVLEVNSPPDWNKNAPALRLVSPDPSYGMNIWARSPSSGHVSYEFHTYSGKADKLALAIGSSGNVGIGTAAPAFPLSFPDSYGAKISFWGQDPNGANFGFGIQDNLLQIHTGGVSADVAFGYGSSAKFTETMRVKGSSSVLLGGTSDNALMFTLGYTGFAPGNGHAEISNDISNKDFKALMLVGNASRGDGRYVQVWDNLIVMGNVYVHGKIYNNIENSGIFKYLTDYSHSSQGAYWSSDLRLKTEVQPVSSALDKVRQLRGVTFHWNEEALGNFTRDIEAISAGPGATVAQHEEARSKEREKRRAELARRNVGVLAQEVEAVLPEAVTTDANGHKSVRYDNLIPLLIEAIKEQEQTIKHHARRLTDLQAAIDRFTSTGPMPDLQ